VLSPASGTEPRYSSLVGVISRYFVRLSVQLSLIFYGPEHLMGERRTGKRGNRLGHDREDIQPHYDDSTPKYFPFKS